MVVKTEIVTTGKLSAARRFFVEAVQAKTTA
jgi:hypothetical protein